MATTRTNLDIHDSSATVAGSPLVQSVDDYVLAQGVKPSRKSPWGIFKEMPILVKLGTIWLLIVLFAAIYAQLDTRVFNGSLPLADPNLQLSGFNAATGEFGTE
jgi:hypothetical protein